MRRCSSNTVPGRIRASGFTIMELMLTLTLGAILMAVAVPMFNTVTANNRLIAQSNEFVSMVNFARSEAITRNMAITLCRALNIPARLVAGYVWFDEPPQDFHAVFEAWLGGRWVLFDPTGMAPVDRVVRIGTGRDAKDVAFSTIFGSLRMTRKEVMVLEHDPRPSHLQAVTSAPALAREAAVS